MENKISIEKLKKYFDLTERGLNELKKIFLEGRKLRGRRLLKWFQII